MALDKRNYRQVVDTTVDLAQEAGVAEIVGRIVNSMKDENEACRCEQQHVCSDFLSLKYRLWFSSQKCRFCLYVIVDFERMAKETRKINKREKKKEEKDRRKTIFEDEFALIPDLDFSRSPSIFSTQYPNSLWRTYMSVRVWSSILLLKTSALDFSSNVVSAYMSV
jgi:hypothetical protein